MKKNYIVYMALAVSLLVSCNKDDDPKIDPLVGKWDMENVKIEIKDNQSLAGEYNGTLTPFMFYGGVTRRTLELNQDLSFEDNLTLYTGEKINEEGSWEKVENKLILKFDGQDNEEFNIVSIDMDALKLDQTDNTNFPDPSDTTKSINANYQLTFYFTK